MPPVASRAWAAFARLACLGTSFVLHGCLSGNVGGGGADASVSVDAAVLEPARLLVEIGKGEAAFEMLTPRETLPLVAGGQGGFHVFVGFRVAGIDPARVLTEVTTHVGREPDLLLTRRGRLSYTPEAVESDADPPAGGGYVRYVGWPAEILDARDHEGQEAVIEVNLQDRFGLTAAGETTVVIGPLR